MDRWNSSRDPREGGTRLRSWDRLRLGGAACHPYKEAERKDWLPAPWRRAALDDFSGIAAPRSVRYVVMLCHMQERCGWWQAFKMVRRYAIIHNTWPAPVTLARQREREYEQRSVRWKL